MIGLTLLGIAIVIAAIGALKMAGGTAAVFTTPYPKGDDGWQLLRFTGLNLTGVTGEQCIGNMTLPFACKCAYAEITGTITDADADGTIAVKDDTGTPKVWVAAEVTTAVAAGAVKALTVVKTVEFYAGSILKLLWTPGDSGDALVNVSVNLWVKPTH